MSISMAAVNWDGSEKVIDHFSWCCHTKSYVFWEQQYPQSKKKPECYILNIFNLLFQNTCWSTNIYWRKLWKAYFALAFFLCQRKFPFCRRKLRKAYFASAFFYRGKKIWNARVFYCMIFLFFKDKPLLTFP